jgi:DNA-binding CsgD family transcriptional regulator
VLTGRDAEVQAIQRVVAGARVGTSGVLVILGEPGVGKTALLAQVLQQLGGVRVLRVRGFEPEREVPFAGLLQLLRPALGVLDRIPGVQAEALSAALALHDRSQVPRSPDRFAVGAAVLSLLCRVAEDGPLAIMIDDLHDLDVPSAEALVFAARRLAADPVVVLATARTAEADALVHGLPVMALPGLDLTSAREMLLERLGTSIPDERLQLLHRATDGNPLALLELGAQDPEENPGAWAGLPLRVPSAVTGAFARRLAGLDEECRTTLLVAAVCGGDLSLTSQACRSLGTDPDRMAAAERAGLVTVHADRVEFSHPLLRAAAYSQTDLSTRRAAHRAVAAVLPVHDVDRRAWHLSEATWHPDGQVADLLVEAAQHAVDRAAYAVASRAYERSARLTSDPDRRSERMLRSADSAWSAGLPDRALDLLDRNARDRPHQAVRSTELALRGTVAARTGSLRDALDLFIAAADRAQLPDDQTVLLADAVHASFYLADARTSLLLANRLSSLAPSVRTPRARALGLMATGIGRVLAGRGGADDIRAAVPLLEATPGLRHESRRLSWLMLAPLFLRDSTGGRRLTAVVDEVRAAADVGALPSVLFHVARDQATTTAWTEAAANYSEAIRLARDTQQTTELAMSLAGLCWLESRQGKETDCRRHAEEALALCAERDIHIGEVWVRYALGDLELSLGNPERALEHLQGLVALLEKRELTDPDLVPGPELADVLVRLGNVQAAREVVTGFRAHAESKGQPWAQARGDRASGLLAPDAEIDQTFGAALARHDKTLDTFELGRTRLTYGERLRRAGRRVDARVQLRAAMQVFDTLGAALWSNHAAAELAATGEKVSQPGTDPLSSLTPQELQVSFLLADGRTTRETAAALFLSPKTVEYHLRKVYTKLGIRSRTELAERLQREP